ncbi:DUF2390 domain-containing protein [Thioalkalivibrio sp. ALJT]|uniref:DUF2390 domain-containing protein n=1 Tax=Thioalkalivibrio sp. ALJT TaxID=1158146 RepID=UPI000374FCAC|nr:DUF2390 domain-containing protein [Thioalkalivibrio sp. ALJT]
MPEATSAEAADFAAFRACAERLWDEPAARQHLLRWQDDYGVDVMLALFALWYPYPLTSRQWHALAASARHWQATVTARVRTLRRALRTPERHALYRALLELELQAEHLAGRRLLHMARPTVMPATPAKVDQTRRLQTLFPQLPTIEIRAGLRDGLRTAGPT